MRPKGYSIQGQAGGGAQARGGILRVRSESALRRTTVELEQKAANRKVEQLRLAEKMQHL